MALLYYIFNLHHYMDIMRKFGLSKRIGYIVIFFKLTHPSTEFSGSETGHIREKIIMSI